MKHVLECDSVILEFGNRRVLQDIYIRCETGVVTGLFGRNGSGKSSLLRIMAGRLSSLNNSVRIDGQMMNAGQLSGRNVTYLPQRSFTPGFLTVDEVVKHHRCDMRDLTGMFPEFERCGRMRMDQLSGGEQRVVEILAVLKCPSLFALLDEPFSHLMPLHVDRVSTLIRTCSAQKGIIVTDHLYEHTLAVSDRSYVLAEGSLHEIKELSDLAAYGYVRGRA